MKGGVVSPVKVKYLLVRPSTPLSEDIRGRVGERVGPLEWQWERKN